MFAAAVIERELRVRSRRPLTSWLRVGVGVAGAALAILYLNVLSRGFGAGGTGKQVFAVLAWMAFALCLLEGARAAAQVISQERREGTLGFLLLTRMTPFEVVIGKFVAVGLASVYALLAVFPAMAITLPAGGLTLGEFWRTQLALLDTLAFTVAAGLWVSSRSRDDAHAILGTFALVTAMVVLPAWLDLPPLLSLPRSMGTWPNPSPALLMTSAEAVAYGLEPARFWMSAILIHGGAWAFLILAARNLARLARALSEATAPPDKDGEESDSRYTIPPSLRSVAANQARELLSKEPLAWLSQRRGKRSDVVLVWIGVLAPMPFYLGVNLALARWAGVNNIAIMNVASLSIGAISKFIVAFVAARQIAEDRASGALELLLATPVSGAEVGRAYSRRLLRMVAGPLTLTIALSLVLFWVGFAQAFGSPSWVFALNRFLSPFATGLHILATCCLGLWLGLWTNSSARAAGLTLVWTLLVPYVLQILMSLVLAYTSRNAFSGPGSLPSVLLVLGHQFVGALYSLLVIVWSRRQLLRRLRDVVCEPPGTRRLFRDFFHDRVGPAPEPAKL